MFDYSNQIKYQMRVYDWGEHDWFGDNKFRDINAYYVYVTTLTIDIMHII